ncbi:MAG: DEAD/DEAH box helicase [Angelakisella sp.]
MKFNELGIIDPILKAVAEEGYETPSPIQEQAIPHLLQRRDLLGCAQTGTGKTAAFAIPILQLLSEEGRVAHSPIRALILTPTRELALQIEESFATYGKHLPLRCCSIFGGVSQNPQVNQLRRGVEIVVATPGRLLDLYNQGLIKLNEISFFVLDEADRMLDMGFIHDIKRVLKVLPPKRQNLLFSATMPTEVEGLVNSILCDPVTIAVTPVSSTVDTIDQVLYYVDKDNKKRLLIDLLQDKSVESALVFSRTKHGADKIVKELERAKISAQAIHGNKSQGSRQAALSNFKNRTIRVLVATDIAARGIDIDELSHVFNYDLPEVPETYVHRIGRTGRAGLSGSAISFCMFDEIPYLKDIEKLIGKGIPVVQEHPYPLQVWETKPKAPAPPRRNKPAQRPAGAGSGRPSGGRPSGSRPSSGRSSSGRPSGGRPASSKSRTPR